MTLQMAPVATQTLQLSQQPMVMQSLMATPAQFLLPKKHCFLFGH